jgi:hypothetical protein
VRLEDDVVRFRVGHLYANPASALRELYANELRACHTARDQYGANPKIQITLNITERTIIIHGIDSLGITEEKFLSVLSVLGENDNQDGSEVGQFGWGIQSFLTIADNILFETFARETGEKFAMLGINGDHYSKVSQPTLSTTGTKVTLFVKDGLDIAQLGKAFLHICAYSDIPTFLHTHDTSETKGSRSEGDVCGYEINNPDLGHALSDLGEKIEFEDEDYQLAAVLMPSTAIKPEIDVRLLRLPIKAPDLKLPFDQCIVNLRDERKYKPTADRERLTDDAVKSLQAKVESKLKELLPKFLDIASFDEFRRKHCKHFYYHAYWSHSSSDGIWRLYTPSEATKKVARLLGLDVWVKDWSEHRSAWASPKIVTKQTRLGEVVEESENIFLIESVDRKLQDLLQEEYDDAMLVKPDGWNHNSETIAELVKQGVRTDAAAEAERIKQSRGPVRRSPSRVEVDEDKYEVILHSSREREYKERGLTHRVLADQTKTRPLSSTRKGELDDDTVFVPHIEKYLPIFEELPTSRHLARLDQLPKQFKNTRMTLERFIETETDAEVATSKGRRTLKSLLEESDILILVYEDKRIVDHYDGEGVLIPLSADEAFELCLFLRAHDASYRVWLVPPEGEFMRTTGKYLSDYSFNEYSFDTEANKRVNIVYHVSLAVKEERMRKLFLSAATKKELLPKLPKLRDFALSNFTRLSVHPISR